MFGVALAVVAVVEQGQHHVLHRVEPGQQVVGLEDEADFLIAHPRQLVFAELADVLAVEDVDAAGGAIQAAQDVHQGRLARTGRPHDCHKLAFFDLRIDPAQRLHLNGIRSVDLFQILDFNECARHITASLRA
jgi:hypothetical protein